MSGLIAWPDRGGNRGTRRPRLLAHPPRLGSARLGFAPHRAVAAPAPRSAHRQLQPHVDHGQQRLGVGPGVVHRVVVVGGAAGGASRWRSRPSPCRSRGRRCAAATSRRGSGPGRCGSTSSSNCQSKARLSETKTGLALRALLPPRPRSGSITSPGSSKRRCCSRGRSRSPPAPRGASAPTMGRISPVEGAGERTARPPPRRSETMEYLPRDGPSASTSTTMSDMDQRMARAPPPCTALGRSWSAPRGAAA